MLRKVREKIEALLFTVKDKYLFQTMLRKYGVGQELVQVPILLKIVSLSLSALLTNCRSQLVSNMGRGKTKINTILFDMDSKHI